MTSTNNNHGTSCRKESFTNLLADGLVVFLCLGIVALPLVEEKAGEPGRLLARLVDVKAYTFIMYVCVFVCVSGSKIQPHNHINGLRNKKMIRLVPGNFGTREFLIWRSWSVRMHS